MSVTRHIPPPPDADAKRNAHLGLWLFALYCLGYAGFMVLTAFYPGVIGSKPFGGINLAIIYGFGLIIGALLLAVIYLVACRDRGPSAVLTTEKHA